MKTRLAVLALLAAAVIVAFAVAKFPFRRPASPEPAAPQSSPMPSMPAREIVVDYLKALETKDFRIAYAYLSKSSQQAHPYDEFVALSEKSGLPNYDLAAAGEKRGEGGGVSVTVPLVEDPAQADFTLVPEGGAWRIVFAKGAPSFPYPE